MLENKTLALVNIPEPGSLDSRLLKEILKVVDARLSSDDQELEQTLDGLVVRAYGLTSEEQAELGLNSICQ